MDNEQQKPRRNRESSIAVLLGFFSLVGALAWTGLILLTTAIAGPGDGIAEISGSFYLLAGSLYLVLIFVSCLPRVRGTVFTRVGVIAHIALLCFAINFIRQQGGILPLLPFMGIAVGWLMLFKAKHSNPPAKEDQNNLER